MFDILYRNGRARITALATTLTADQLATHVAATPEWTVHELLAHLVGGAADAVAQRLDGVPGEAWTARHVGERRDRSVDELLAEWAEVGPPTEARLANVGRGANLGLDILCHECDLRETLGLSRLDRENWESLLDNMAKALGRSLNQPGTLIIQDELSKEWTFGSGEPTTRLRIDGYEIMRATFSRRSQRQIADWNWYPAPARSLSGVGFFGPREDDQPIPVALT